MKKSHWISVEKSLPEDGEQVLAYIRKGLGEYAVVIFEKGISLQERSEMEKGNVLSENVLGITYDGDLSKPIYHSSPRWKIYTGADEHGNNKKPYYWRNPPMQYFGQDVTHWIPLPESPHHK